MDINAFVLDTLKTYKNNKRKIEQLKFELGNPPKLSDDEVISALSLGSSLSQLSSFTGSHVSDRTMAIAMKYRDTGERLMSEAIAQITRELSDLETEVTRLEHYLSLLPEKHSTVIRLYYFEGMQNTQIADKLGITSPTVVNRKNAGVKELTSMYQFLFSVKD